MKDTIVVCDLDGTLISSSVQGHFRKVFEKKSMSYCFAGLIATLINKLLNLCFLPSLFSATQYFLTARDVQKIESGVEVIIELNTRVLEDVRSVLQDNDLRNFIILTGSPKKLVECWVLPKLTTHFPSINIEIIGAQLVPGSFLVRDNFYGWTKLMKIRKISGESIRVITYGNVISDGLMRFRSHKHKHVINNGKIITI